MSRELTSKSNLDALRKEAKRWHKAIEAGDPEATARYSTAAPGRSAKPKLREVQHALSHQYGFASWAALKQEIEDRARTHAERVELFLEKSVHRYGADPRTGKWGSYERDGDYRGQMAARLLARHPQIAREDIHAAVLAHDIAAVRDFLAKDPALARQRHPFDGWAPLARLAYARLPVPGAAENALPIAMLLLDAGADPDYAAAGDLSGFRVLTGVIGGGEAGQSAHPQAEAFARLLIARGADPLDGQALYDTSLGPDDTFWLDLLWAESEKRGDLSRWHAAIPNVIGPPLEYLLGNAVPHHPKRVAWLLAHGADARTANAYSKQPVIKHAVLAGAEDVADMLVKHGATMPELSSADRFLMATVRGDRGEMRRLAGEHPEFLRDPEPMFAAIRQWRTDIAEALLDLGMSPNVGNDKDFRALHFTTHCGAKDIATLLISRGAEIDALERNYNSTALGHATYQARPDMVAVLAPLSRDVASLCWSASVDRLHDLLVEDPALANKPGRWGERPLFCLPDQDEPAAEVVELLLSRGADPRVKNSQDQTPAEAARIRGLEEAAALLEDAARG